jgi:hypothetical protein
LASFVLGSFQVRFARFFNSRPLFSTTSQLRFAKKDSSFLAFRAEITASIFLLNWIANREGFWRVHRSVH